MPMVNPARRVPPRRLDAEDLRGAELAVEHPPQARAGRLADVQEDQRRPLRADHHAPRHLTATARW